MSSSSHPSILKRALNPHFSDYDCRQNFDRIMAMKKCGTINWHKNGEGDTHSRYTSPKKMTKQASFTSIIRRVTKRRSLAISNLDRADPISIESDIAIYD